jgi:peptide/nickel transport system permease protein
LTDIAAASPHAADVAAGGGGPDRTSAALGTLRFVAMKIGGAVISLLLVVVLGFFLFRVIPGDPVKTMTRDHPTTPQGIAQLRERLGLDKPLFVQFLDYLGGLLHGDLGSSYLYNAPVSTLILQRLWPTVLLVGTATIIAAALGLWLGARAGWRRGSTFDHTHTGVALTLWSVPQFWLGLILLMVFGVGVGPIPGVFPVEGMTDPDTPPGFWPQALDTAHHLVLPCVTLIAVVYAQFLLIMRSSLVDETQADYLTTARAKGLRDDLVRRRHAVPNALLPTVTLIFLNLGLVVSGSVTVEAVFSWPGLGQLMYQALQVPDLPLVQGAFITLAGAVVVMNVLAELLYRVMDPRVRT